jgi:Uma2 family endonuclease
VTRALGSTTLGGSVLVDQDEIHRLSIADVVKMYEVGILDEDDRTELIDGVLLTMSPPSETHSRLVAWLTRHFVRAFPDLEVRVQDAVEIDGGYLSPDVMVIDPGSLPSDLANRVRTALLVVEVCLTSQQRDRMKALLYARAGVGEYWMIDVPARQVLVHREPAQTGYAQTFRCAFGASLRPHIGGPEVLTGEMPEI